MKKRVNYFLVGAMNPFYGHVKMERYTDQDDDKLVLILTEGELTGSQLLPFVFTLTGSHKKFDIIAVDDNLAVGIEMDDLLPEFIIEGE